MIIRKEMCKESFKKEVFYGYFFILSSIIFSCCSLVLFSLFYIFINMEFCVREVYLVVKLLFLEFFVKNVCFKSFLKIELNENFCYYVLKNKGMIGL